MDSLIATARLTALEHESPLAARLAELASLAVRVDAGLLRRLRQALLPEADPGIESDLWFSAIVESRGPTGFQLAGSVLPLLRQRLQADPARLHDAAAITREAHAGAAAAVRLEESLNLLALSAGGAGLPAIDDAAAAVLDAPLRTLAGGGDAALDVARWAVRAAGRLDERVRRTRAAQMLLLAASLRLGMQRAVADAARDDLPLDWLARMLPSGGAQRRIGVVRVAGGLQFREPEDGIASFEAPATDPLLVGLSWQAQGVTQQRTVEARPLAVVPLDGDPDELTLTTLAGDRYRLGSAPAVDAAQAGSDVASADPGWQAGCLQLRPLHGAGATRAGFIVDDGFGLTVAAAFEGVDHVVDARSGRAFALLRSAAADPAGAEDLVVLQPASDDRIDLPPLPLGTTPPGQAAVKVAAIGRDAVVRWLDVVLQPRAGAHRQALLPTASGLGDTPLDEALLGAPVFDASGVVGAVVAAQTLGDGSSGVRLRLVEADALRERLRRARPPAPWLRWRVALVAVVDELGEALDAVAQALRTAGHEVWTPDRHQSLRGMLAAVDDSEVFVGLVGWRSGYLPDDDANPLHKPLLQLAFEHARERRLPCLMALSRREVPRARGKDFDDRMGMAAFREQLKIELLVIEFDEPTELATRLLGAIGQLPDRGAAPQPSLEPLDLRVVHGDIREAAPPLLVGHYDGDGISGVEGQLDELLQGALSRRFALGLYPGPAGTSALVRGAAEGAAAAAVLVAGLGTIGELSPSILSDTLRAALLARAMEREPAADQGAAQLHASCLLVGSGEGGVGVGASAIAVVEAALQANTGLRSLPGGTRYQRIEIVEAVAERAADALAALQRWAERSPTAVRLAPAIERRHPPKEVLRGDWWHRLQVRVDDRGAFGYTLTASGPRAEVVHADSRTLADRLLATTAEQAGADPEWRRTLTELLLPAGLLSPLLMVDRLALRLDAAAAPYPWELLDRDLPAGRTPPLAARLGLLRQPAAPARAAATPIDAGPRAGVFAADAPTTSKQASAQSAKDIALAVASRLEKAGFATETVVNQPVTEMMARWYGEPLRLLHLAAPIAWPSVGADAGTGGAAAGFRFGTDLVLSASEIRQMRAAPQLVFCSLTVRDAGRPLKDWPGFAAAFAQDLLQAGVRAVVVPGWPVDPTDLQAFTLAFYDALAQGRNFGDAVLYARGAAWKRDPKGTGWAAFQCWGNPGLTLRPAGDRRPAA